MSEQENLKNTFATAANTLTKLYMMGLQGQKSSYQQGVNDLIFKLNNFLQKDAQQHPEDLNAIKRLNEFLQSLKQGHEISNTIIDPKITNENHPKPQQPSFQPIEFQFGNFQIDPTPPSTFQENIFHFNPHAQEESKPKPPGTFSFPSFNSDNMFKDDYPRKRTFEDFDFEVNKRMKPDQ